MASTLSQLLQATFGIKSTVSESVPGLQVGVVEGQLLSFNPNRLGLVLVNNGGSTIYITPRKGVTVGRGIRLLPNGGTITMKWDVDFETLSSELYAIADGAASDVYYMETVSY